MLNAAPPQTFWQRKVSFAQCFLTVIVLTCLLAMGCKSTGNKSIVPFFGGGTSAKSPESEFSPAPPPTPPAQPITINEGTGPATPSSPVSSSVTSRPSNAYSPPDMLSAQSVSPVAPYARDNMTEVYDIPPGTKTNSGGSAGTLPSTYSSYSGSGYSGSSTGYGGTSSSSNSYDYGRSSTTGSGSNSGRTYPASNTSSSTNDTKYGNSSSYGGSSYGGSSNSGSSYGGSSYDGNGSGYGDSSPYDRYNHGQSTGHSSSLVPTDSGLEDGDYLANDGSMMRVINGKKYELVQYIGRPPILPDLPGISQSQSSTQPQIVQTATPIQISTDYRTATQMTESFRQVPIPSYESLLNQQANGLQIVSQGVITVAVPATTTTIVPDNAPVETVPSLDYSEYSHIGTVKVPSSVNNSASSEADDEMERSIWSIMSNQNHDLLLYSPKTK